MFKLPDDGIDNSVYSFMYWTSITNKDSSQYKLREKYKNEGLYDSNGLADIKKRKVIACTKKFGEIGDEIEVTFKNNVNYFHDKGTLLAIIGDIKSEEDNNIDEWGHLYSNGKQRSVIEFIVQPEKFNQNITIKSVFPLLKRNPVIKIVKTGAKFK